MEWLPAIKDVLGFISATDFTGVVLLVFLVGFISMMLRLNMSKKSSFFYDQLFIDADGKASTSKLAHLVVLTVSTWGFVHLTLKGTLSEWYFLSYITVWVAQRGFTKWVDMQANQGGVAYSVPPPGYAPQNSVAYGYGQPQYPQQYPQQYSQPYAPQYQVPEQAFNQPSRIDNPDAVA